MKQTITFWCLLLLGQASAQQISIGQQCPDLPLTNIINTKIPEARITDFRGKGLVLMFWADWCSGSTTTLPVLASLQQKLGNKVRFLPVTAAPPKEAEEYLSGLQKTRGIILPSVAGDRTFRTLFPHYTLPHFVWLDPLGRVSAITDLDKLTEENLRKLAEGQTLNLQQKKDLFKKIDESKPVFTPAISVIGKEGTDLEPVTGSEGFFQSIFTPYQEGLSPYTSNRDSTRFTVINTSIASLYQNVLGRFSIEFMPKNRLFIESGNPGLWCKKEESCISKEWIRSQGVCYELKLPPAMAKDKFKIAEQELNRYFGALLNIEGLREKRKVKCYVLQRTGRENLFASKGGDVRVKDNNFYIKLQNAKLDQMMIPLVLFYQQNSPYPLLDETGYTGPVDLEINANLSDMKALNRELARYGLQFKEAMRKIDVIVIRDRK